MRHIFSIKLEKFVPHFQETSGWRFVNLWYPLVLSIQLSFLLLFFHFIELLLFNLSLIHKYMFLALDRACRIKTNTTVMFSFMVTMALIIHFYFMFILRAFIFPCSALVRATYRKNIPLWLLQPISYSDGNDSMGKKCGIKNVKFMDHVVHKCSKNVLPIFEKKCNWRMEGQTTIY